MSEQKYSASPLINLIQSEDPVIRNQALEVSCRAMTREQLETECYNLDRFRRQSDNLYRRVRALFFLYAIYRFHLPDHLDSNNPGLLPYKGYNNLLHRRFKEAIDDFLAILETKGVNDAVCSALASAYYQLGLQELANQVRFSVRSLRGNQWMFRMGHPTDHPLRIRPELIPQASDSSSIPSVYPVIQERTPVRMDLSHSGWSDIFFLGMDYPEGARVLNVSIDLGVLGRDKKTSPPIEACFRVIDEPVIRLVSVDLQTAADISSIDDIFDFAQDYLGLLKAALIASGIIPIGLEGSGQSFSALLERVVGRNLGIELVSSVNNIPKGSRLAVSTNLLAALIAVCMRATGQTLSLEGQLQEDERRVVAARAILGEWLAGSGGGWQDSGGVWPGIKEICGCLAEPDDTEFGISRGGLLPRHRLINEGEISGDTRRKLQESLVLVHGGMAQNVGPILEMVTEKYLLRTAGEWEGRQESIKLFDEIVYALRAGNIKLLGELTTRHFFGPLQTIIPWATNRFTELLIDEVKAEFGDKFWGFWMLGGMSGGGMGFIFDPQYAKKAKRRLLEIMCKHKKNLEHALPFAMDPVVYDFSINHHGTRAKMFSGASAILPADYYPLMLPRWLRTDPRKLTLARRVEVSAYRKSSKENGALNASLGQLIENMMPTEGSSGEASEGFNELLEKHGFDPVQHEQIRGDLKAGLIGLAQNRLQSNCRIEDASPRDVKNASLKKKADETETGQKALLAGEVGVVTLAAGAGSRWTSGAGVVKALNPFCRFQGKHRNFLEIHLAKSRKTAMEWGISPVHIITTGYLTHQPIAQFLNHDKQVSDGVETTLSFGSSVGLRLIPTVRDLRFAWEELSHQILDERAQKVRHSLQQALMQWAQTSGEAEDYRDNIPLQCLHPVGHWFEIPNLLLNGTLLKLLRQRPQLKTLFLHNIDTTGANLDPMILGMHRKSGACLSFEVIPRRLEDRGGGLARVDGKLRLVEGLAIPHEEDEFKLSYYNTLSTWIEVHPLLELFGLGSDDLSDHTKVVNAVREMAQRLPTYITLKDVKKRWGHGQEDVFPVCQFEKLWGDMTTLTDVDCSFIAVPRNRGQQLKDPAQLDGWLRDGSTAFVDSICHWK